MNGLVSIRKAGKLLLSASLVIGLCPLTQALAEGMRRPYYQCPPGQRYSAPAPPYYTTPAQPRQPGQVDQTPGDPARGTCSAASATRNKRIRSSNSKISSRKISCNSRATSLPRRSHRAGPACRPA